jgi:hypothetical protein
MPLTKAISLYLFTCYGCLVASFLRKANYKTQRVAWLASEDAQVQIKLGKV